MLHPYNYKTMYLCSVKQCMLSTLYSVWGTWLFPSLEGFNGSNTHRCSAHMKHFSRKWAASADLGCQTITSQIFAAFSFYFSSSALKIYWQRFWKSKSIDASVEISYYVVFYRAEMSSTSQEDNGHQSSGARAPELWCPHLFFEGFLIIARSFMLTMFW